MAASQPPRIFAVVDRIIYEGCWKLPFEASKFCGFFDFLFVTIEAEMAPQPVYRLGVDVGGTFTDLLLLEEVSGET